MQAYDAVSVLFARVAERWRKAIVVTDSFRVVGRVESPILDAPCVVTEGVDPAEGAHDLLVVIHLNDAVVVLIADQRMTVPQPHSARGQRAGAPSRVAVRIGIGEVLPDNVLVAIDLDDAGVIRIRDEGIAVFQPAGESNTAHRIVDGRVTATVLPHDLAGAINLNGAVVVFVADKDVAILQTFGAVRIVELLRSVAGYAVVPNCQRICLARLTSMIRSFA
jgi:hypothetical protein